MAFFWLVELLLVYCFDCLESICLIDVSSVTTRYLALPRIITGLSRCLPKKFTTRNVQLRNLNFKFQFFTCRRTFFGTLCRTHHVKMINLTRLFTGLPGNVFLVDLVSSWLSNEGKWLIFAPLCGFSCTGPLHSGKLRGVRWNYSILGSLKDFTFSPKIF